MRDGERERFEWIYVMRANETILDLRESVRELLLDKDYDHWFIERELVREEEINRERERVSGRYNEK